MFVIAIHGGAGLSSPKDLGTEREAFARTELKRSLLAGESILKNGGSAVDAVIAAVAVMEDSELFNAGIGSVIASDGKSYMDASLMDGKTMKAGALCGSTRIKNPIKATKKIMDKTPHVMIFGEDLNRIAVDEGLELLENEQFHTQYRIEQLQEAKKENVIILDHEKASAKKDNCKGTVGAVALDQHGNIAAATSTGGLCNKRPGRVGDSALIGAGTYAKNDTCAVSATGHGELFIRSNISGRLSAMIEFGKMSMSEAAEQIVFNELPKGSGGLIAIDTKGNITLPFNTGGMFRGLLREDETPIVSVWDFEKEC
jgi:beta-aspartyl-peptidase (threonine type)